MKQEVRSVRWRMGFVAVSFLLLLGAIMARAVQIQVLRQEQLRGLARDQYVRELSLPPRRGAILAAGGEPLASSVDAQSVFVMRGEFAANADPTAIPKLAQALEMDPARLKKRLQGKGFAWLKRQVSSSESRKVRELDLPGVGFAPEFRRYYPQGEVAGHLLGFVGIDHQGLEGLERVLDSQLRGRGVDIPMIRDSRGRTLIHEPGIPAAALVGASVELTLDLDLQLAAEKALAEGVAAASAKSGILVALEPRTGAVLAMATAPAFNPNTRSSGPVCKNRALSDTFEPGSTLKAFVMAGALEEGAVRPAEVLEVGDGSMAFGRRRIRDSSRPKKPRLSLSEAMATSSNVAFAQLGLRMGANKLVSWLERFGFGDPTGLGMGEAKGQLHQPSRMYEIDIAAVSFGQGMTATPVQMAAALSALANEGRLMRPYLVQRIVESDGSVVLERKPELVRQVVSPQVARAVTEMMVAVTEKGGSGTRAAIEGVRVAGKTGTAQKADPVVRGYSPDKRFSSFMGFAPAEDPKVVIFVGLDEPKGDVYGGVIAAPIFQRVAADALLRAGVLAAAPELVAIKADSKNNAEQALGGLQTLRGDGSAQPSALVGEQSALHGLPLNSAGKNSSGSDGLGESGSVEGEGFEDDLRALPTVVPDLLGLPTRQVLRRLAEHQLEARLEGSGLALGQNPAAGSEVPVGSRVVVSLGGQR